MAKCKECKLKFNPFNSFDKTCSKVECKTAYALKLLPKIRKERAKVERKELAQKKLDLRGKPELKKICQRDFNKMIRSRDAKEGCISCDKESGYLLLSVLGGLFDAGHYRSIGSAEHIRFDERNCHKQCKHCNDKLSGNFIGYRKGLIEKLGLDVVEALEADQEPRKYIKQDYIDMSKEFRKRGREYLLENA